MLVFLLTGYTSLRRASKALGWTLGFTAILLLPLGGSFVQLIKQAQLEASLKQALLNRTITFQRVVLLKSDVNWLATPPEVRLNVRAKGKLTPYQVKLLEEFIEKEMGQKFT